MRTNATRPAAAARARARAPRGFTLVELLVVIVILAVLVALLMPAIGAAIRSAKQSAVQAEINQMAQALESFKSKYGIYPPSRVLLVENGNYNSITSNAAVSTIDSTSPGTGDITVGELATRSLSALRKIFPRVQLSTTGIAPGVSTTYWYDFNGNGVLDGPYVLRGHECLTFFLGGVPLANGAGGYGMTGFGKDPRNPFTNSIVGNMMYNANRQPPFFEFAPARLFLDPSNVSNNGASPMVPAYYDTLNNGPPSGIGSGLPVNFYAYFSSYGNGNYDPNDVNISEMDNVTNTGPIALQYNVGFFTNSGSGPPYLAISPSPNPYTTSLTALTGSGTVTYQKPQSYQIISSGVDGLYGVGGQYVQSTSSATIGLPVDQNNTLNLSTSSALGDNSIRQREYDNLTNFKAGTLQ